MWPPVLLSVQITKRSPAAVFFVEISHFISEPRHIIYMFPENMEYKGLIIPHGSKIWEKLHNPKELFFLRFLMILVFLLFVHFVFLRTRKGQL